MSGPALDPEMLGRFKRDLDALMPSDAPLGIAVSGGADSLALLRLANAARPGMIRAATVDHRLRPEGEAEARTVAAICATLDVPHDILTVDWENGVPQSNVEAMARNARYALLDNWTFGHRCYHVATGHHAEDQAETLLMRLARGSGLAGLTGIRASIAKRDVGYVRPLLRWTRAELRHIVDAAGWPLVDDPHNADPSFDRARLRAALADADFHDAAAYAASASHLAEAEEALQWMIFEIGDRVVKRRGDKVQLALAGIPRELRRRLLSTAVFLVGDRLPRGSDLAHAMERVEAGNKTSLGSATIEARGDDWIVSLAPPRRTG